MNVSLVFADVELEDRRSARMFTRFQISVRTSSKNTFTPFFDAVYFDQILLRSAGKALTPFVSIMLIYQ